MNDHFSALAKSTAVVPNNLERIIAVAVDEAMCHLAMLAREGKMAETTNSWTEERLDKLRQLWDE